jgi:hypothetical protein
VIFPHSPHRSALEATHAHGGIAAPGGDLLTARYTDASFPVIGDRFGGRDHSTVIHAAHVIERRLREGRDLPCHRQASSASWNDPAERAMSGSGTRPAALIQPAVHKVRRRGGEDVSRLVGTRRHG